MGQNKIKLCPDDEAMAVRMYAAGCSTREIGNRFWPGIYRTYFWPYLRKAIIKRSVPVRNLAESQNISIAAYRKTPEWKKEELMRLRRDLKLKIKSAERSRNSLTKQTREIERLSKKIRALNTH